jgi:hypothetical protein
MKAEELAVSRTDRCCNIASLTMPALSSTFFHFFSTLLHPLRDERHFALVEISAIPTKARS